MRNINPARVGKATFREGEAFLDTTSSLHKLGKSLSGGGPSLKEKIGTNDTSSPIQPTSAHCRSIHARQPKLVQRGA
jgi:hypothetical protein